MAIYLIRKHVNPFYSAFVLQMKRRLSVFNGQELFFEFVGLNLVHFNHRRKAGLQSSNVISQMRLAGLCGRWKKTPATACGGRPRKNEDPVGTGYSLEDWEDPGRTKTHAISPGRLWGNRMSFYASDTLYPCL